MIQINKFKIPLVSSLTVSIIILVIKFKGIASEL